MPITVPRRLALASLLLAAACSSKSTAPNQNSLVGTWVATQLVFTSQANPATTFDAIANNYGLTMIYDASGSYTFITTAPGLSPDTATGTVTLNGNSIALADDQGGAISGTYTINGNTLTVHLSTGITYDFGAGEVAATADGTLIKQ